jgi:hypothetical protein
LNLHRDETERFDQYRMVLGINHGFWQTEVVPRGSDQTQVVSQYVHDNYDLASRRIVFAQFRTFVALWLRLLLVCSLASLALEGWDRIHPTAHPRPVFGPDPPEFKTFSDHFRLSLDAVYLNVVTLGTTGFGEFAPANFAGKIMASLQIIVGIVYLGVGLNIVVTMVVDTLKKDLKETKERLIVHVFKLAENQWNFNL